MQVAMFPGQGSQSIGMGKQLTEEFPATRHIFEEAEDALSIKLRALCFEGPESELKMTANQQPAILTVSYAMWTVLRDEADLKPGLFCGHSLGEYSALAASKRLPFAKAVQLVRKRGQAMQDAVPAGQGAMAAVMKMQADSLQALCTEASSEGVCEIVNFNSEAQFIVSGATAAIEKLIGLLKEKGTRAVPLPVSAPFHSSLMAPARTAMESDLNDMAANLASEDALGRVVANLTGEIASPYTPELLTKQIDHPVLWTDTMNTCLESGAESFIEIGPGKVLFGLARRSPAKAKKLLNTEDIKATIKAIQEGQA